MPKVPKSIFRATTAVIICVLLIAYTVLNARFKPITPDEEFAFNPTPQNGQLGSIEGIYYHRASSPIEILDDLICKTDGWDDCTSYHLLRFYNDGVVFSVSIGTDDGIQSRDFPL